MCAFRSFFFIRALLYGNELNWQRSTHTHHHHVCVCVLLKAHTVTRCEPFFRSPSFSPGFSGWAHNVTIPNYVRYPWCFVRERFSSVHNTHTHACTLLGHTAGNLIIDARATHRHRHNHHHRRSMAECANINSSSTHIAQSPPSFATICY